MNIRTFTSFLPLPAALLAALVVAPAASAQLVLNLTPPSQAGTAPGTFLFTGTLTNPTASDVNLYSDLYQFNVPAAGLSLDDSPFGSAPAALPAGMSYTGGFFSVSVDPTTAPGTYSGTFSITDGNPLDGPVASKDFFVTVVPSSSPAVPEASTTVSLGLLLALGLGGIVITRRRKPAFDLAA